MRHRWRDHALGLAWGRGACSRRRVWQICSVQHRPGPSRRRKPDCSRLRPQWNDLGSFEEGQLFVGQQPFDVRLSINVNDRSWAGSCLLANAGSWPPPSRRRMRETDPEPPFNPAHTQRHLSTYSGRTWLSLVSLLLTRLLGRRQRRFIAQPITAPHLCDDFAILRIAIQPGRQRKVTGK
jgi:hypothetical protein